MRRGESLEATIRELAENKNEYLRQQMFCVPIYLKALFCGFASGVSIYDDLITLIHERGLSVTFLTLNYDMILDGAIERKYRASIHSMDSYVSHTSWQYIKLHGSVNWGYRTGIRARRIIYADGPSQTEIAEYYRHIQRHDPPFEYDRSEVVFLETQFACHSGDFLIYPALAVRTNGQEDETVCPPEHVEALHEALRSDPAVLVIGNQGLDTDLMGILRDTTRGSEVPWRDRDLGAVLRDAFLGSSRKPFLVVDPLDSNKVASRFAEALHRREFDEYDTARSVGFREFVESGQADRFLDDVREASR